MTREKAIKILKDSKITYIAPNGKQLSNEALDMAIQSLSALNEIKNIVDSAEMIIEEQYGVVIVEGYADVFDLIKKKVRLWEE